MTLPSVSQVTSGDMSSQEVTVKRMTLLYVSFRGWPSSYHKLQ